MNPRIWLLVALAASGPATLHAAEPMFGRWAADPSLCAENGSSGQALLVVTKRALRWSGKNCRIGRSYRTGDTLHVEVFCGTRPGRHRHGIPVSLRLAGDRIFVVWNRIARGELRRCR